MSLRFQYRPQRRISNGSLVILIGVAIVLSFLAALQYRWITEVSEAEQNRQKENLAIATTGFAEDFDREFRPLFAPRRPGPPGFRNDDDGLDRLTQLYDRWTSTSRNPDLLKDLFFAKIISPGNVQLFRFNPESRSIDPAEWPVQFSALRDKSIAESVNTGVPRGQRGRGPEGVSLEHVPAVVMPVMHFEPPQPFGGPRPLEFQRPELMGWEIVQVNQDFLTRTFLPSLVQRHFSKQGDFDYDVLVAQKGGKEIVYQSSPNLTLSDFQQHPDAIVSLMGGDIGRPQRGGPPGRGQPPDRGESPDRRGPPGPRGPQGPPGSFGERFGPRGPAAFTGWQLYAKHHSGSLQSFTNQFRRRNLLISFGVFAILAIGIAFTFISSERVRAMGKLQLEFAAGLSHELRTPLAVIRSAGYNLATGNISSKDDLVRYGKLLQEQGVRLSDMVEQALLFAQTQSGRKRYERTAVEVEGVIQKAIDACQTVLPKYPSEIVTKIAPGIPLAMTDPNALGHCLQNLLINALKYGSIPGRIHVTADVDSGKIAKEVQIMVENGGPGIDPADLPHIFEPFFRGRNTDGVTGSGLGLYLVKSIIESLGGRVVVSSSEVDGTRFTLHIPAVT